MLRIADEMSFSISRSATALKSGKALRVALLMSDHIRLWFSASVIGYDDSFYAHDIGWTTIRQDPIGMAREAACKTLDLINRKTTGMPFQTFPAQLIVRSSTSRVSLDKG